MLLVELHHRPSFCSPWETATTAMGTHIFPFGPQAVQRGQGKIRAYYFCAAIEGTTRSGCMTRAHNLLSRRIVYSIYYNSTLLLPVRGEGEGC